MGQSHEDWVRDRLRANRRINARSNFAEFADDPCGFAVKVLGLTMWMGLEMILTSLRDNPSTYVVGGHKLSKSTGNVAGALWWCAAAHPGLDGRWAAACPSAEQVKRVFWNELTIQLTRIAEERPQVREMLGPKLGLDPSNGWRLHGGAQIIGVSTDRPEKVAGVSAPWLVINIDEATGYSNELFLAWQGNEAGGAKFLNSSNPTQPDGWFYDGLHDGEANVIRLTAYDSPNVIEGRKVVPGLADPGWVAKMERKYGPNPELNPEFQVRVLGQFPARAENQIISMKDVKRAQDEWIQSPPEFGRLVIGVDPARFGVDECVIQPVRGQYAYPARILSGATDGKQIGDAVIEAIYDLRRLPEDRTVPVVVDGLGIAGGTAVDFLKYSKAAKQRDLTVSVHEGDRAAKDEKRFTNRRTEVWFEAAEWLKNGGTIQKGQDVRKELGAAVYRFDGRSRLQMESKDKMKKRLHRSPNRADALTLAVTSTAPLPLPNDLDEDDFEYSRAGADWM